MMMLYENALKIAEDYFAQNGNTAVSCALDAPTHWIFYGGKACEVEIGGAGIKIHKASGDISDFILPDAENFRLLDAAQKIF